MIEEDVIGKTYLEAVNLCADGGYVIRVAAEDGEQYMLTMDLQLDRVNVRIENGIVVSSYMG